VCTLQACWPFQCRCFLCAQLHKVNSAVDWSVDLWSHNNQLLDCEAYSRHITHNWVQQERCTSVPVLSVAWEFDHSWVLVDYKSYSSTARYQLCVALSHIKDTRGQYCNLVKWPVKSEFCNICAFIPEFLPGLHACVHLTLAAKLCRKRPLLTTATWSMCNDDWCDLLMS